MVCPPRSVVFAPYRVLLAAVPTLRWPLFAALALALAAPACHESWGEAAGDAAVGQFGPAGAEIGHQDAPLQEGAPAESATAPSLARLGDGAPPAPAAPALAPVAYEAQLPIRLPGEVLTPPPAPADFCTAGWIYRDDAEGEAAEIRRQQEDDHFAAIEAAARAETVTAEGRAAAANAEVPGVATEAATEVEPEPEAQPVPAPFGPLPEPPPAGFDLPEILGGGAPRLASTEPAGPRFFDNVDHAGKPKVFACFRAASFFPALAERYDALGRCSVEESKRAVERFGEGSFVVCKGASYVGCSFLGGAERFHFNYTRELWRPSPQGRELRRGPIGGGLYVVLPPERTLQLAAPLTAWRASPPELRRDQLPTWAQEGARCLSCDQLGTTTVDEAGRRGRCLEEHTVAVAKLAEAVERRAPGALEVVVHKSRELYLQTPQQWRVLHRPDQAFLPRPWEAQDALLQLLGAADLPQRNLAHLSMCVALSRENAHPGRLAAHAATCMERAQTLLDPERWAALAPSFGAAFGHYAPAQGEAP